MLSADSRARAGLRNLFPAVGPWTSRALWHGLVDVEPPAAPLDERELELVVDPRLAGLMLRYIAASGATVPDEHLRTLREMSFAWSSAAQSAAAHAGGVVDTFRRHDIPVVVSKGPGIARWYPGLDCRPYSDVDLVVAPHDFARAVAVLAGLGWREDERNRQPWPYFVRYCREGLNLHDPAGGSVDLHHRVPPWLWSAGLRAPDLMRRAEDVQVAGTQLPCLSSVDNLAVAALHVVSDRNAPGRSLIVWRDIVQLAMIADPADIARMAGAAGLGGWLRSLLTALPEQVRDAIRPEELVAVLPDQPIPHPRRLRAALSPRTAQVGVLASQFLRLPLPNGVGFLAGMAVPSPAFVALKFPGAPHRYRTWWLHRDRAEVESSS